MRQEAGNTIKCFKDLDVYQLSYELAMTIFELIPGFPKEETYSLSSQVIRSSRSVPANISEGWAKREYENVFKKQLLDAIGSVEETKTWLDFAKDCNYISEEKHHELLGRYEELGAKLHNLHKRWRTF